MIKQPEYRVLLFYKYVKLPDAEAFANEHRAYCHALGVKGRILVAEEGINGTVSGTFEQTEQYMNDLKANPLFSDIWFKIDDAEGHAFKKMFVRLKPELVTLRYEKPLDPTVFSGNRLSPKEWLEYIQRDDVVILDGRNDYEWDLGHFRGAIRPSVESFKEFPEWVRKNMGEHKDKKVLTYCTGGIRCEKLTGVLMSEGFEDVYQLEGGIVTYGKDEEVKGRLFDGKCYVFDERISVQINHTDEDVVVGRCHHCGDAADIYINCADDTCHLQHIVCPDCLESEHGYCSDECETHDREMAAAR
ncbi:rhodanese-related sulfurtransferase [Cohnella sp. AR92]|uniref:oxygen-dependent tRNA uridine(34) hydroxylase TrhO n=1 Tax=Cohnella sp. AR92 TaxID=648716 RepID=UPI000F8DF5DE|nr:rhodanese-related sulfurtransferase [Cohnella sp. AR92]RUS47156.1 rhodanese-related sulfurtransferase [Cohnella sp. AR92]